MNSLLTIITNNILQPSWSRYNNLKTINYYNTKVGVAIYNYYLDIFRRQSVQLMSQRHAPNKQRCNHIRYPCVRIKEESMTTR